MNRWLLGTTDLFFAACRTVRYQTQTKSVTSRRGTSPMNLALTTEQADTVFGGGIGAVQNWSVVKNRSFDLNQTLAGETH